MVSTIKLKENTTVNEAAELLMDLNNTCLLVVESIMRRWDIVIKTIEKIHI